MAAVNRTLTYLLMAAMLAFGAGFAQDDQPAGEQPPTQEQPATEQPATEEPEGEPAQVAGEEFVRFGDVEVTGPEPLGDEDTTEPVEVEVETGALVFTASTADDQHPNIDLVGPDNYYQHFELDDAAEAERVIDGLLPGVYSVAATDDGLQLAHTLVEVVAGQAVRVAVNLDQAAAEFVAGQFADQGPRTYPENAFRGDATTTENANFGEVTVETDNEDAHFVVTGPNGYSREFNGEFTASDLEPGVYTIAGTADGAEIATTTVEVDVSTAQTMVPAFTVTAETEEVEGDVAGGGAGEEGEAAPETEEPAEPVEEPAQPEGQGEAEGEDEVAGGGQAAEGEVVTVALTEYAIDMPMQVQAGTINFEVTNDGTEVHNFEIEGEGIEESFPTDLQPGETRTLTVELQPGTYHVYCPVGDHEDQGMTLDLEVTGQ
jgi:hypothetical protein